MNFKLNKNADIFGTFLIGTIDVSTKKFTDRFGKFDTNIIDLNTIGTVSEKTSMEFIFTSEDEKRTYTIYDYKQTNVYDSDLEDVVQFWNSESERVLHIGGFCENSKELDEFKEWIYKELEDKK